VNCFTNARNVIPYIQDIKIINAFCDRVSDLRTVEEIAMKKPKTMANLLAITDVCKEASEAQARPRVPRQGALEEEGGSGGQHNQLGRS
jgi:hypothetical protein